MKTQIENAIKAAQCAEQLIGDLQALHASVTDPLAAQVLLRNIESAVNLKRSVSLVQESLLLHSQLVSREQLAEPVRELGAAIEDGDPQEIADRWLSIKSLLVEDISVPMKKKLR